MKQIFRVLTLSVIGFCLGAASVQAQITGEGGVPRELCRWAPEALIDSFNLSHGNFAEELAESEIYFTSTGKADFDFIVANSRLANMVLGTPDAMLSAEYMGGATIAKKESLNEHWLMSVPLRLSVGPGTSEDAFLSVETDPQEEILLYLDIWDLPQSERSQDFAIMELSATALMNPDMSRYGLSDPSEIADCQS